MRGEGVTASWRSPIVLFTNTKYHFAYFSMSESLDNFNFCTLVTKVNKTDFFLLFF